MDVLQEGEQPHSDDYMKLSSILQTSTISVEYLEASQVQNRRKVQHFQHASQASRYLGLEIKNTYATQWNRELNSVYRA